jgi:hypothetical protein
VGGPGDRRIMVSAEVSQAAAQEVSQVGTRLDEDHAPETNGRMSVCRRCGTLTDGPAGRHHVPVERQLARSSEWLMAQSRQRHIDRARVQHLK